MRQPQGREDRPRDIAVRDHDMVRSAVRRRAFVGFATRGLCHALPCFAFAEALLRPSGAVGRRWWQRAAGSWQLTPGQAGRQAGRVDDRMLMQARLHSGSILIALMRARCKQAGGLAGRPLGRPSEHSSTTTRWQDTARSRRQPPAPSTPTLQGQGRRWLLLIRLISTAGQSCPGQEGAAQQAQESAHVA